MSGFGASKSASFDGVSIASLPPGIYTDVELVEVKMENATKKDDTEGKKIITFMFNTPKGMHQITEWDTDEESKQINMVKRIEHIMSKFVTKEQIETNNSASFEALGQWVLQTLGQSYKGVKDLELKVVGSVYQGTARSETPRYVGFIARKSAANYKPLNFSAAEIKGNKEYEDFQNARPDTETDTTSSTGADNKPVDTDF